MLLIFIKLSKGLEIWLSDEEHLLLLEGPEFNLQSSYGSFQSSITPFPEGLMPSSHLQGHQACTWHRNIHTRKILIHVIKVFKLVLCSIV